MNFAIGKTYSFNTKAPAILGSTIQNAKLLSIMDYSTAITYDNIDLKYRTIHPLLPLGTPDQPDNCMYYRFLSESSEKIVLADQWIEESTIELIEHVNLKATFNQVSIQDISRIRDLILAAGYTAFTIEQI